MLFHTGEGKPPESHHIPKVILGLPQSSTKLATRNVVIPIARMLSPHIQTSKLHYTQVHPKIIKIHFPFTQIIGHHTKFNLPTRKLLPTVLTYCRATEHTLLFIKSKLHYTKIPFRITKLQCQTAKQTHIHEAKLSVKIQKVINRCLLLYKAVMTLVDPDSRKSL